MYDNIELQFGNFYQNNFDSKFFYYRKHNKKEINQN